LRAIPLVTAETAAASATGSRCSPATSFGGIVRTTRFGLVLRAGFVRAFGAAAGFGLTVAGRVATGRSRTTTIVLGAAATDRDLVGAAARGGETCVRDVV
jgi:hypothetical protein